MQHNERAHTISYFEHLRKFSIQAQAACVAEMNRQQVVAQTALGGARDEAQQVQVRQALRQINTAAAQRDLHGRWAEHFGNLAGKARENFAALQHAL